MATKPANLVYGLEDRPSWHETFLLALQHLIMLTPRLIYPVIIVQGFGGPPEMAKAMVSMSMIAGGVGSILQALPRGRVGSGFLDPSGCGAAYIFASIQAGTVGGPSLILGMTALAGVLECLLSQVMHRLRALFPPHVLGLVVTMVGLSLIKIAVTKFHGVDELDSSHRLNSLLPALLTLGTILSVSIWGKGKLKLYSLLVGVGAGYAFSFYLGATPDNYFHQLSQTDFLALPDLDYVGWSFDSSVLALFMVAFISTGLKTAGEIITCQKINDQDWQRPDMRNVSQGMLSDGLTTTISGLIGGMGQSSSASNIGLCMATRSTSRIIAFVAGGMLVILAFVPVLPALLALMPAPVAGATLVVVSSFMVVTGIQIMTSRMLDSRKIYVIGVSMVFGLSVEIAPRLYQNVLPVLEPMFHSSLALTTILALLLNLVFRLGVTSRRGLSIAGKGEASSRTIFDFMEKCGAIWGARPDVVHRAGSALNEVVETAFWSGLAKGPVQIEASFDEFNLDLEITYEGQAMRLDAGPSDAGGFRTGTPVEHISEHLIRNLSDHIKTGVRNGHTMISLHFDH
jgi:NCS2 family nucleobase:cation symporter-2